MKSHKKQPSNDDYETWLKTASHKELDDGYEERRLEWLKWYLPNNG